MTTNKFRTKGRLKILSIAIVLITAMIGGGCTNMLNESNNNPRYAQVALDELKERYGEEFEVKDLGGGWGATRDTYKLICNPINNKNKYFNVEVSRDLNEVEDSYICKLMQDKLDPILYNLATPIFGEDIKIKSNIDFMFSKYISLDMDVKDYLKLNDNDGFSVDIFKRTDSKINKKEEANKISMFMDELLQNDLINDSSVAVFYVKKDCYNNIENTYYENLYNGIEEMINFYSNPELSYGDGLGTNRNGKQKYTVEQIENLFIEN